MHIGNKIESKTNDKFKNLTADIMGRFQSDSSLVPQKQNNIVDALPSILYDHSPLSDYISDQNHPDVGVSYDDWVSSTHKYPPQSYTYVKSYTKKNVLKTQARQYILHLPTPIDRQSSFSSNLTILIITSLLLGVSIVLAAFLLRPKLENHEMCGITTGGQEECYFDCLVTSCYDAGDESFPVVHDPSCLQDCFINEPDKSCIGPLIKDVLETGTCSETTKTLLGNNTCRLLILEQQILIRSSIINLIVNNCNDFFLSAAYIGSIAFLLGKRKKRSISYENGTDDSNITRLAPAQFISELLKIRTKLPFENTRNRYPWICSLRSTGTSPAHQCAVNLLSIPPKPTVVVGAAHCTYLCKEGAQDVPACCCTDGPGDCSGTRDECGNNPGVVEMTGDDVFVICGDWNTSEADKDTAGEKFNVKLPILSIVRHPSFDPAKGPINGNDLAVFKVDDSKIINGVANSLELWPACLPPKRSSSQLTGIQTGWSAPPPLSFIQNKVPGYESFYEDFYKQWHYKMDIFSTCEDPSKSGLCGEKLKFPSNSSYPPGTFCAKAFTRQSCFSTGDSGSPLMVQHYVDLGRYYLEGILSFVKGCDVFSFGPTNLNSWILDQRSENPTTYTKLSCFLPWIAEQYFMSYEGSESLNSVCSIGTGDPQDGENTCRNTISNANENIEEHEIECKFPFYYKGVKYDECILLDEDGFVYPVFRCPIRDITTKIDGINSFQFTTIGGGLCLSDPTNGLSALDPNKDCNDTVGQKRAPFSQCKNNCPGVQAFGIIGGGAVLAGVSVLGGLGSLAAVAGVGTVGVVGAGVTVMLAQSMCAAPFYCNTISRKCCLVVFSINGIVCPDEC